MSRPLWSGCDLKDAKAVLRRKYPDGAITYEGFHEWHEAEQAAAGCSLEKDRPISARILTPAVYRLMLPTWLA